MTNVSRRGVLAGAAAAATASPTLAASASRPVNPLVLQRADAQIFRHSDGWYYMMASVPEYDRLAIRRAKTLAGLSLAEEAVVWTRPTTGRMGGYIWAPELHHFNGRWYIYFGAGNAGDVFHVRTYVLECKAKNPMKGSWSLTGQVETPWDTFTLDATTFVHRGQRYLLWAQGEPGIKTNSNLYLAPMASALTLSAPPARLSVPELEWETRGYKVNEGPAVLARHGRLFLTYSASATDENYCLGLLTARGDADIMDPKAWVKSPEPVFKSSEKNGIWGPGHNSFTVDEKGHDVLVYHARNYRKIIGNPLHDPNRHTRVQLIQYDANGVPVFGEPVANGVLA